MPRFSRIINNNNSMPQIPCCSSTLPSSDSSSFARTATTAKDGPPMDMPPIRIPGEFLVTQGISGVDPLLNTMDPPANLQDLVLAQVCGEESSPPPTAARQATTEHDRNNNNQQVDSLSAPIQDCFAQWRRAARDDALRRWHDWKSRLPKNQGNFYQSQVQECWWRHAETGCLASFDEIPNLRQRIIRPTGSLPPGTAVKGLELYSLAHDDNNTPAAKNDTSTTTSTKKTTTHNRLLPVEGKRKLFPWNRLTGTAGEVLLLKYKTRPRRDGEVIQTGYCVFSIDGYPFLYPGSLDDYANLYMKRWFWKVVGPEGLPVVCGSPEDSQAVTANTVLIPYGSTVEVTGCKFGKSSGEESKEGESSGEKRLSVSVFVWNNSGVPPRYERVQGWCRQCNESGDTIVEPLPCTVPVLFEVVARSGENLTTEVDTRSHPHLFAPYHSWITVTHRAFCDRPVAKSGDFPERLCVAGCGWISRRADRTSTESSSVVRLESWDSWFDPDSPEVFHYLFQRNFASKIEHQKQKERKEDQIPLDIVIDSNATSLDEHNNSDVEDNDST